MADTSQKRATRAFRKRSKGAGLVRVEVQARKEHSELIKSVAKVLREDPAAAFEVRRAISDAPGDHREKSSLEMFAGPVDGSGREFDEIFEQPRNGRWREVDL